MSYDITYEEKNGKILVQCDRGLYKDIMKNLAGRWNTKFAGFLLPIEKKEEIKALIEGIRDAQKEENEEKEENNQREEKDDNINTRFEPKEEDNREIISDEKRIERETDNEDRVENNKELKSNEDQVERETDTNEYRVERESDNNEDQVESNQEFKPNEDQVESNQEFTSIKKKLERDTDNEGRFESNQEKDHKINSQYDLEYDDQIEEFTNPKKNLINDRDIEIDNEIISSQNKFQSINQRMPPVTQKFVKENLPSFMDSEDDELDNNFIPPKRGLLQKKEPKVQTKPEPKVQYKPEPKVQIKKEFKVLSDSENESFYQPPIKNKKVQTPSPSEYSDVDYNEYSDDEDNQDEDENGEEEYEEGEESESDCEIEYSKYVPPSKRDSFRKEERIEQPKNVQSYFQDKNRLSSNQKNSSNKYTKEEKEKLKRKVELLEIKKAKKYGKTIEEVRGERKQTNIRFQDLINKVLDLQQRLEEIEFQLQQKNRRNY